MSKAFTNPIQATDGQDESDVNAYDWSGPSNDLWTDWQAPAAASSFSATFSSGPTYFFGSQALGGAGPSTSGDSGQIVSSSGGTLTFDNTYVGTPTAQFEGCVVAAEDLIEALFSPKNSVTINVSFQATNQGNNGDAAENSFYYQDVSYSALTGALPSSDVLPASDPSPSGTWIVPLAYGRMLGIATASETPDDAVTVNTYYGTTFGQDTINALVHELSEGSMGRIGELGGSSGTSGGLWSTMDLFRYTSAGVYDDSNGRDGKTTYFSSDGGLVTSAKGVPSLSFNNQYNSDGSLNNGGDTADWTQEAVFGSTGSGETLALTQTELDVMEALGWSVSLPQDIMDASGDWQTPTDWSIGCMPIAPEDVLIGALTATSNDNVTVNSIGTESGSLLTIGGDSTLTATDGTTLNSETTYSYESGNNGVIRVDTGSTLAITGGTFDNAGSLTIGYSTSGSGTGTLTTENGFTLNGSGALYLGDYADSSYSAGAISGYSLANVNNAIYGGGSIDLSYSFDNQPLGKVYATQSFGNALSISAEVAFSNEGYMYVETNATLQLGLNSTSESLTNKGDIFVGYDGSNADLDARLAVAGRLTVTGVGVIAFKGAGAAIVSDGAGATTFTNNSNIEALDSGQIGDVGVLSGGVNDLTFDNTGTTLADLSGVTLTLNTGANTIGDGGGLLEAEGGAILAIDSNVTTGEVSTLSDPASGGTIEAATGGIVDIAASITDGISSSLLSVAGTILISGGTVDMLAGGSDAVPIKFSGSGGTLELSSVTTTLGTISGFGVGDTIEFTSVSYSSADFVTFVGNGSRTGGTVTIDNSSGIAIASFVVSGDYEPSQFKLSDVGGDLAVIGATGLAGPTAYDFNGDGHADILWRDPTTGADSIWDLTPSGGRIAVNPGTVASNYEVAGIGDFNNDGIADILWRNTTTGADSIWDMTPSGGHTTVNPGTVATSYVVAGVGDFNGDGVSDILWRDPTTGADSIWDLTPSGGRTAVNPGTVASSYVVAGVGDFNGDGISDILWRNTATGADSIWDMNASGGHTAVNPGTVATSYEVAGVGDFNGDGISDILWRNTVTGADSIWDMNASGGHTAINPGTVATTWQVAAVEDFNGDGIADILWRNTATGVDTIWDMNASGGHTTVNPGTVATSWNVAT